MSTALQTAPTEARDRRLLSQAQWCSIALSLGLSSRELQIVQCIFDGRHELETAHVLGISAHTVRTHLKRLYRKLGVGNRCELLVRIFAAYVSLLPGVRTVGRARSSKRTTPWGKRAVPWIGDA